LKNALPYYNADVGNSKVVGLAPVIHRHLTNVGTYKDISNKVECAKLEI
jgi:hypothetical protein